jgi:hypothetical protein
MPSEIPTRMLQPWWAEWAAILCPEFILVEMGADTSPNIDRKQNCIESTW